MTAEIAGTLDQVLRPHGVAVVVEGVHGCMTTRGVSKRDLTMVTSRMLGAFRDQPQTRHEFLASPRTRTPLDTEVRAPDKPWRPAVRSHFVE